MLSRDLSKNQIKYQRCHQQRQNGHTDKEPRLRSPSAQRRVFGSRRYDYERYGTQHLRCDKPVLSVYWALKRAGELLRELGYDA